MIHFLLKMVLFPGKMSSISVETSTQLCLATAFHHSLTMSPSSLGWCHLKRPVFGAGFCWGGIQHIQTKMTQTSKKMFIVISCYITKIAFEQSKMPWPKVKCESLCSYHQKSNQEGEQRCMPCSVLLAHVNKQMFSRINTGLKILTFHQQPNIVCLYYPPKEKLWPKPPANLTTEEPHISSHLWRDRLAQGLLPRQLADECHWRDSVFVLVCLRGISGLYLKLLIINVTNVSLISTTNAL